MPAGRRQPLASGPLPWAAPPVFALGACPGDGIDGVALAAGPFPRGAERRERNLRPPPHRFLPHPDPREEADHPRPRQRHGAMGAAGIGARLHHGPTWGQDALLREAIAQLASRCSGLLGERPVVRQGRLTRHPIQVTARVVRFPERGTDPSLAAQHFARERDVRCNWENRNCAAPHGDALAAAVQLPGSFRLDSKSGRSSGELSCVV